MLNSQGHFRLTQGHFQVTSKKIFAFFCTLWHTENNVYIIIKYSKIAFLVRVITKM